MGTVIYLSNKPFASALQRSTALISGAHPDLTRGWIGNDPTRIDHDQYPRLRASRRCWQCLAPKPVGLLRCPECNKFDVTVDFLETAERFLGGEPKPARRANPLSAG